MKNMSTFAVSSPKTMTLLLTKSGNFFIVCGLPCISNGATNPHGLLDLSSDLSLARRGEVALSAFILKQFSIMLKPNTVEIASNAQGAFTSTPSVAKHRPSYKAKFISERDLKNTAYHFILSMGLINEFRGFCANQSRNPHHDCLSAIIRNLLSE